mgnify:CR=1 FL=1
MSISTISSTNISCTIIHCERSIHDHILRCSFESDILIGSSLIDMYAKYGCLDDALCVFERLQARNVVSWGALIAGHVQHGHNTLALKLFDQMQQEGIVASKVTFLFVLKACGNMEALDWGMLLHHQIITSGLQIDMPVGSSVLDMYAKCGKLHEARKMFDCLPSRDIVSWGAMIGGYAQQEQGHEALACYEKMQNEGISANAVTFICILKACGSIGAIDKGEQIHEEIIKRGLLVKNIMLGNALVDMYARCGMPAKAHEVLKELPIRDVISWSAMIAGFAQQEKAHEALYCFDQMQKECHQPTEITLLCVLNACSRAGKFYEAQMYYENMNTRYGIRPKLEHHTCMVVVYGSSGCFDKAISVIKTIPSPVDPTVWIALLDACRKWGNMDLGSLSFDRIIQLELSCSGDYVLTSNFFTSSAVQEGVGKVGSYEYC